METNKDYDIYDKLTYNDHEECGGGDTAQAAIDELREQLTVEYKLLSDTLFPPNWNIK